ncbi:diguanylate cyclase [Paenibacillus terrae]|uniref:Putative signaling protein n=1 Tax=Paenibacillus terrae (strain HPL-003) TaxID=985665 RepID=G7VPN4_PAETH|nr:diguanylate cyclase [Paenibacillus terrae]AET61032.1 putative signaling protein [Paenibacillus terrae HPL-003]
MLRYMIANFALLTAFLFLFNHLFRRYLMEDHRTLRFKLLTGITHGCCALLLLLFSYQINETSFIDFRHIVVISSAYFGGLPASLVTALFFVLGRVTLVGTFTPSPASMTPLLSITLAAAGSGIIMQVVKCYKHRWLLSVLLSMTLITVVSLMRGITKDTYSYLALVGLGGLFAASLIAFFSTTNQLTKQLEQSERKYRSLHALQEAIFQSAVGTAIIAIDWQGQITHANKGTEKMLGYRADELIGKESPLIFHDPNEVEAYGKELSEKTGKPIHGLDVFFYSAAEYASEGREWSYIRKDGARITVLLTLSPLLLDGKTAGVIGLAKDISERKKMEEQLKQLSLLDGLTKIANRRFFDEMLKQEWQNAAQNNKGLSLIFLDIDHFKAYNDLYGHQAGDDCLRKVTAIAKKTINHPAATIARYGGEEFTIILPDTSAKRAAQLAESLRLAIENTAIHHNGARMKSVVTVSIGVATCYPDSNNVPEELIAKADEALYYAKGHGRNRIINYKELPKKAGTLGHDRYS